MDNRRLDPETQPVATEDDAVFIQGDTNHPHDSPLGSGENIGTMSAVPAVNEAPAPTSPREHSLDHARISIAAVAAVIVATLFGVVLRRLQRRTPAPVEPPAAAPVEVGRAEPNNVPLPVARPWCTDLCSVARIDVARVFAAFFCMPVHVLLPFVC